MPENRYPRIEDHGIIGDLYTVALVCIDGCIDFLCLPNFDSPSVFASLVDVERGGSFQLAPELEAAVPRQLYLPDTNVLLTRFLSDSGVAEVSDFMPVEEAGIAHNLVRRVKAVRGEITFHMRCDPRFDYGRVSHTVALRNAREAVFIGGEGASQLVLRLRSSVPLTLSDGAATADFSLRAEQSASFILEVVRGDAPSPCGHVHYSSSSFKETVNYWRRWIARSTYGNRWREVVNRSALVLKLLTSRKHGSIVAAPTFGLPEHIGGVRNWDYRYCWIRDSSFTLYGLMRLGYTTEAYAFMHWIMTRVQELEPGAALPIMYSLDGSRVPEEQILTHLEGYAGSRPVRIGNAASSHLQLDIYGELLDALYIFEHNGPPIGHDAWMTIVRLIEWLCEHWREKDESIWEVRGGRREFLYSRVMCWVAIDRAIRIAQRRSFPAPVQRWYDIRDLIYQDIYARFWNEARRGFMQSPGGQTFDAAALLMPLVHFISPTDPRWISTLQGIERELVSDSLVYRYRLEDGVDDGVGGEEGTFSMCSFWYVECLSRAGDLHKARFFFEKMLAYANHLGLYGEELGSRAQHLGNFPQAFTHLALISAAYDLDKRLSRAGSSH